MTLAQLQYFRTLAHVLHYTRAAEELHIAQPSLSYSINELEKELGVKLFTKEDRKVVLTMYGEQFLPYVESALSTLSDGTEALRQLAGTTFQVLRLGYFHSISASFIPQLVRELYEQDKNKKVRFQFTEATSSDIFSRLKKGELDLGFAMHRDEKVESVPVLSQPLFLVVPAAHPLAEKAGVTVEDFSGDPIVLLDKASSLRGDVETLFQKHGFHPNTMFVVRECNAALKYVTLNSCVSVLPQVPAMDAEDIVMLPIEEEGAPLSRTVYLSWARDRQLSSTSRRIRDYIVDHYALTED